MTFSSALSDLIAASEQADLAAELGRLTHQVIELESGVVCIPQAFVIGLIKLRMDEIRRLLGQEQKASQACKRPERINDISSQK